MNCAELVFVITLLDPPMNCSELVFVITFKVNNKH